MSTYYVHYMDARQDTRNFLGIFVLDDSTKHWTFRRYLVHGKTFFIFVLYDPFFGKSKLIIHFLFLLIFIFKVLYFCLRFLEIGSKVFILYKQYVYTLGKLWTIGKNDENINLSKILTHVCVILRKPLLNIHL